MARERLVGKGAERADDTMGAENRTLAAAGMILVYAVVIGFTDNYVRVIAAESGLWQFHAIRTAFAMALIGAVALPFGLRLRPVNPRAVAARSAIHGLAILVYFGGLGFLPVAQVAAGLFTAPIFVLLIARFAYGHALGPVRIVAVAVGFAGVVLVLGPAGANGLGWASLLPVLSGAFYALGNIATREWCGQESALTLTAGFFLALGALGLAGMAVLWALPVPVPEGTQGFLVRGAVWPSGPVLFWIFVQAAGSLVAVGAMVKGYQLAEASRVSILEYMVLPVAALWTWALWGEAPEPAAVAGIALIIAAGTAIVLRGR